MLCLLTDDDYRGLVDKYSNVRNEFEDKLTDSCRVSALILHVFVCKSDQYLCVEIMCVL